MFENYPDRQVGELLLINGKDAYQTFEADLISFVVTPGEISLEIRPDPVTPEFRCDNLKIPPKILTVSLFVHGSTFDQLELNKSHLLAECRQCVIKSGDMRDTEYVAALTSVVFEETGIDSSHKVDLTFSATQRGPLQTITYGLSNAVNNPGSAPSPCRFTITSSKDLPTFQINGITVNNIQAKRPFVIDGIAKTVTQEGENKWQQTDLINFPILQPGKNSITFSPVAVVTLEYYPLYL